MKRAVIDLDALEAELRKRRKRLEETAQLAGAVLPTYTLGRASGLMLALSVVRELAEDAQ